jgi:hypothetical protein
MVKAIGVKNDNVQRSTPVSPKLPCSIDYVRGSSDIRTGSTANVVKPRLLREIRSLVTKDESLLKTVADSEK